MDGLAFVQREIIDVKQAKVPLLDRGYLLGDGLFETLRTVNGQVFRRKAHQERFVRGLKALGLEAAVADRFDEAVDSLVAAGTKEFGDSLYLRVNGSTGLMEDIGGPDDGVSITGICRPFKPYPMQYYAHGIRVITTRQRVMSASPLAGLKTLSFLPYIAARRQALAAAAHDGLILNEHGRVVEASTSNIFAKVGDTVHSPGQSEGAVQGVSRDVIIELLDDTGVDVERRLTVEQLSEADEVWLTNTTGGVVPVTTVDDVPVGEGKKGELTTRLGHAFEDLMRGR